MAGSSPSGSTSPHSERRSSVLLLRQAEDAFSDDSGVDVKPKEEEDVRRRHEEEDKRRNKRKSSEPKRRKDVLLMKRFRWEDTDDEEEDVRDFEDEEEDVFEDVQRPGSGDSGCTPDSRRPVLLLQEEDNATTAACRQSVIRKTEASTTPPLHHRHNNDASSQAVRTTPEDLAPYEGAPGRSGGRPRNYKSMSRQRRIEANARERTRVHTISAAFESLRRAVPAYAHNQKLSKLAILRIASAYIVALACLNGDERRQEQEEEDTSSSSVAECVERCTRTIQAEGRSRRRTSTKE